MISLPGQKKDGFHCASSSSGLNQILPDQKLFRSSSVVHALRFEKINRSDFVQKIGGILHFQA